MIREKRIAAANVPTPAAGTSTMFVDTDGLMKVKDENGVVRTAASTPLGSDVVNTVKTITGTSQTYTVEDGISVISIGASDNLTAITLPNPATNVGRELKLTPFASFTTGASITYTVKDYLGNNLATGINGSRTIVSNGTAWVTTHYALSSV